MSYTNGIDRELAELRRRIEALDACAVRALAELERARADNRRLQGIVDRIATRLDLTDAKVDALRGYEPLSAYMDVKHG